MSRPPDINTSRYPDVSPLTTGEQALPIPNTPPSALASDDSPIQASSVPRESRRPSGSRTQPRQDRPSTPPRAPSPAPDLPRRSNAKKKRRKYDPETPGSKAKKSAAAAASADDYASKAAIQAARDRNARTSAWRSFKTGCSAVFAWSGWKVLCAFSTYATAVSVPLLMLVLATSGSELVPSQWRIYFTSKDGVRLGAWGWQEPGGQARFQIIYTIPSQPWTSTLTSNTAILSALLLALGAAGIVFLTSFALLALRVFLIHAQCCSEVTMCCSAACAKCYDPERLEANSRSSKRAERSVPGLERWWFEVTMWWMMFVVWILAAALLVWDSQAGGESLVGMAILTATLILASKWLVLRWLYRSSWSGVSIKSRLRLNRGSVRDRLKKGLKKRSKRKA